MSLNAAILFEPEAYVLDGPKLMGRQAAGNAYLRAAVAGRGGEALAAYTPRRQSAEVFGRIVQSIDADAKTLWIPSGRLDMLANAGTLYLPGPVLREAALLRLRLGVGAYSLTGVTHTTASHVAMDAIAALPTLPVMPWDAVICTSTAVLATVREILAAEYEYLTWRFGRDVQPALPQFPVIPLGVHVADFAFDETRRSAARAALGIGENEVVALFVGRLSFHAKAHPYAMYLGLEEAARRSGKKVALIQCGWFANEMIETAFKQGAARYAPSVRALFTDGRDAANRELSWAAADLFISLSDNIQETFGLAPVEAMAAGLPTVVTDWNGYKDTIRRDVDGFLIPTAMPARGAGVGFAAAHETEEVNYDQYCGITCRTVSVDLGVLSDRLTDLIQSPDLRRKLGTAGQARAKEEFDWSVVYRRYQTLWSELARLRASSAGTSASANLPAAATRSASSRLDPMHAFAHYATRSIGPQTRFALRPDATLARYKALASDLLFSYMPEALPSEHLAGAVLDGIAAGQTTPEALAAFAKIDVVRAVLTLATLAKMGLVKLEV